MARNLDLFSAEFYQIFRSRSSLYPMLIWKFKNSEESHYGLEFSFDGDHVFLIFKNSSHQINLIKNTPGVKKEQPRTKTDLAEKCKIKWAANASLF